MIKTTKKIFLVFLFFPMIAYANLRLLEAKKIKKAQIGTCRVYESNPKGQQKKLIHLYHFNSEGDPILIVNFSPTNTNRIIFAYRYSYYGKEKKIKERYRLDIKPILIENYIYPDPFTTYITLDNGLEAIWTNAVIYQVGDRPLMEKYKESHREITVSHAYSSSNRIIDWKDSLLHREVYLYDKKGLPFSHTFFLRGTEDIVKTCVFENDPKTGLPLFVKLNDDKNKLIAIRSFQYTKISNSVSISGKIVRGKSTDNHITIRHGFTLENEKTQVSQTSFSFQLPVEEPGIYHILTDPYHPVELAVYPKDKIFVEIDAKNHLILKCTGNSESLKIQQMKQELAQYLRANKNVNRYDVSAWLLSKLKDLSPSLVHISFLDQIIATKNNLTSIEALVSRLLKRYPRNIKLHTFIRDYKLDIVK